jgi:hypothetical protein
LAQGSSWCGQTGPGECGVFQEWIDDNGECDWICFDDEVFTDDPRLFVIDFDRGIDYDVYPESAETLEHGPKL